MKRLLAILKLLRACLPYIITALGGAAAGTAVSGCSYDSLVTIRAYVSGYKGATLAFAPDAPKFARSAPF